MDGKTNQPRWWPCALFLLAMSCTAVRGGVIYVDEDAVGANDGSSWIDAFSGLQDAIAIAQTDDDIHVAQGVYTPTHDPLDRDATFELKNGVSILGGYAGSAGMYPDFRHTKFYTTILSGDIDHNDDPADPNTIKGNSRHVVMCTGEGNVAILDGVIVTGGYSGGARPHYLGDGVGGGLFCQGSSLQLIDCVFANNYDAVYVGTNAEVMFSNCVWEDNRASGSGAAIFAYRNSSLSLNDCVFRCNTAVSRGGAIYADSQSSLSLNRCFFQRNAAEQRGGAIYANGHEMQLINCLFVANTAGETGGAISCTDYIHGNGSTILNVLNCTFYGNSSPTFYKPPTNSIENPDVSRVYTSGSIITNCIFYNEPSEMALSIEFGRAEPLIVTSIYEKQQESGYPRDVPPPHDVLFVDPYGPDGVLGSEDDDLRLAPGSPAIDAGTNETEPPLPPTDLDGNPRIFNDVVDLGAYEFTDEADPNGGPSHLCDNMGYGGGSGEPDDPYLIYTAEQMNAIGAEPDDWDKHFKLMADIDLGGYAGTDFNVIGSGVLPAFTGVFDGDNHTISNFTYSSIDEPCIGIFGYIDDPNACIRNLGLIDPNVDAGTGVGVGSLAGWMDMGTITNCYAVNGTASGEGDVGGLVGSNAGLITGCFATGNVTGLYSIGGLVGGNTSYNKAEERDEIGVIQGCHSAGSVTGDYRVGGLVGNNSQSAVVKNSSSTASIDGKNRAGGLVGENRGLIADGYSLGSIEARDEVGGLMGANYGVVTTSYSSVGVMGWDKAGGLVGYNSIDAEIVDCYANGSVLGRNEVGGLAGSNATDAARAGEIRSGTIRHCYSTGFVLGDQRVGGLIGRNGDDRVSGSFWDVEASGRTASAAGVGKITAEMQTAATFLEAGWDFVDETANGTEDVWWILEGQGYPRLWWEVVEEGE